jgi:hypothetical protein
MELLPSTDERKWLVRYMRKLIERAGWERFVSGTILEPTRRTFPEIWSGTVRDVHVVTQRLMHAAGIGGVRFVIEGYSAADGDNWDAGTAGWFAGIHDGRCRFGVQIEQLHDPEQAAGVMAHEVAHAWRQHHKLMAEAREREEFLTDLTTIYLGFGILTTNNTDRYRTSGDARESRWSNSSAGYLPPQAMAWLLALQVTARGEKREAAAVARHLEVNQAAAFSAAMKELERSPEYVAELHLPERSQWPARAELASIVVYEPANDEACEASADDGELRTRNAGQEAYRVYRSRGASIHIGSLPGLVFGLIVGGYLLAEYDAGVWFLVVVVGCSAISGSWFAYRGMGFICSESDCHMPVHRRDTACSSCGASLVGAVSERELRRMAEEELDRAAAEMDWEECDECEPEQPCAAHVAREEFDRSFASR